LYAHLIEVRRATIALRELATFRES
jgi:hypothetical protein